MMTNANKVQKVLIVALDNLGDAVMATALLKPLKKVCPQAAIGFWVKSYAAGLFQDQSLIDIVHASDPFWDRSPGHDKGQFSLFRDTWLNIRREKYDVAFVLNTEWRRSLAVFLAGIPGRVGFKRRQSQYFLNTILPEPTLAQHFVSDHLNLLEGWSGQLFSPRDFVPRLEINQNEKEIWAYWSNKVGWKEKSYIAIHPFSGDEKKTWPLSCWVELLQSLLIKYKKSRFVLFCGPGEESRLQQISSHFSMDVVRLVPARLLGQTKAILYHSLLLVGGDSGPGHIAAALGVPVISLFGPTDPERSRPLGHEDVVVLKKDPLRDLRVSEVSEKIESYLEKTNIYAK